MAGDRTLPRSCVLARFPAAIGRVWDMIENWRSGQPPITVARRELVTCDDSVGRWAA